MGVVEDNIQKLKLHRQIADHLPTLIFTGGDEQAIDGVVTEIWSFLDGYIQALGGNPNQIKQALVDDPVRANIDAFLADTDDNNAGLTASEAASNIIDIIEEQLR